MKAIMRDEREMKDCGIEWIGDMPKNWKTIKLKYKYVVQSGYPFDSKKFNLNIGMPLIRIRDITSGQIETYYDGDYDKSYIVHKNDFLIGMDGDFNVRWWNNDEALLNQRCCRIIEYDESACKKYVYYALPFYLGEINDLCYATTVKHLSVGDINNAIITFPKIDEQKNIVAYLDDRCSKIDAIIAEAKASIEEYKELKQAVIYEALTKGLNKNIPMKNSGIKWIGKTPINWEVTQLKRYIDILPGYAFSSDDFAKDGIPLLRGINVTPNGTRWDDVVYWNQSIDDNLLPYMLKAGDIVVGLDRPWISDGTRAIIVKEADLPCLLLQRVCRIRVSSNVDYRFVYYWLIGKSFENALTSDTTGISVPHISTNQIGNFIISFPSLSEQILICDYVDKKVRGISSLISEKQSLIEDLEAYKKSLIYEVVTGKRKVVA